MLQRFVATVESAHPDNAVFSRPLRLLSPYFKIPLTLTGVRLPNYCAALALIRRSHGRASSASIWAAAGLTSRQRHALTEFNRLQNLRRPPPKIVRANAAFKALLMRSGIPKATVALLTSN